MKNKSTKLFNHRKLKEARLVRGYSISELAEKLGVSKQAVSQFERGLSVPKTETFMSIINTLDFPRTFFYSDLTDDYEGNTFFRANATATKKSKEVQLNKSKLAKYLCTYLEEYVEFPDTNLPNIGELGFDGNDWNYENIDHLALLLREYWGIEQEPVPNIVHLLEKNGVMVIPVTTETKIVDGYSQHRTERPFIFLANDKRSFFRRQFDGAHELGHILMHEHIDDDELLSKEERNEIEDQANRFASTFLLPEASFSKTVSSYHSLVDYIELKKYWYVSMSAMIMRSYQLGIISESRYTSLQKQISMKKYRKAEPLDDVYPVQEPVVLRKSILLLLDEGIKTGPQVIHETGIPQEFIEMFANLEEGTLNYREEEPSVKLLNNQSY